MVDEAVVRDRLATLRTNAVRLAAIVSSGRDRFVSDEDIHLKAERCLQICIQAILDIGTHFVAARGLERPAGYEDVIPELARAGIIDQGLADRMRGVAGLRNILVHDYLRVDLGLLFDNISAGLKEFDDFAAAIDGAIQPRWFGNRRYREASASWLCGFKCGSRQEWLDAFAENILANKLTALVSRNEAKDFAGVLGFRTRLHLAIAPAIEDAQSTAAGVFPADLARVLLSAGESDWKLIRWIEAPPLETFLADLRWLGEDLLLGPTRQRP